MLLAWFVAEDCLSGVRVVCRGEEGLGEEERLYVVVVRQIQATVTSDSCFDLVEVVKEEGTR